MAYLKKDDYTLRISLDVLDEILTQAAATSGLTNDQVLAQAEALAIAEVRAYLVSKYKIGPEFSIDSGSTARNMLILCWVIDITLFSLHFTVNPRDIPEIREKNYKRTIEALKAARDSNIILEIPQVDPFYTRHLLGSNPNKFVSHEFTDPTLYE